MKIYSIILKLQLRVEVNLLEKKPNNPDPNFKKIAEQDLTNKTFNPTWLHFQILLPMMVIDKQLLKTLVNWSRKLVLWLQISAEVWTRMLRLSPDPTLWKKPKSATMLSRIYLFKNLNNIGSIGGRVWNVRRKSTNYLI